MLKRKPRSDRNHALYLLVNDETGERYIGIAAIKNGLKKTLKVRWQKHVRRAVTENKHWNLCKNIRKYGHEAFIMEFIMKVRGRKEAHEVERKLITEHKPELNQY